MTEEPDANIIAAEASAFLAVAAGDDSRETSIKIVTDYLLANGNMPCMVDDEGNYYISAALIATLMDQAHAAVHEEQDMLEERTFHEGFEFAASIVHSCFDIAFEAKPTKE